MAPVIFEGNVARFFRADLYAKSGNKILFKRPTRFINNSNGGIWISATQLHFEGHATFTGNFALIFGGGIGTEDSNLMFSGEIDFVNNETLYGGGAFLYNSTLILRGTGSYINNKAGDSGGVVVL